MSAALSAGAIRRRKASTGREVKWMEFGKETRPRAQTWVDGTRSFKIGNGQGVVTGSEECVWVRAWIREEEEMGIVGLWTPGHSGEEWGVEYGGHGTIKYNIHRPTGKRGEN